MSRGFLRHQRNPTVLLGSVGSIYLGLRRLTVQALRQHSEVLNLAEFQVGVCIAFSDLHQGIDRYLRLMDRSDYSVHQ